jgi:ribose transport system ATP-binding protein
MKILAGAYIADEGGISIDDIPTKITDPASARQAGINLIYQELNVAPNLTVTENMYMGSELKKGPFLDRQAMQAEARQVLASLGATLGANTIVEGGAGRVWLSLNPCQASIIGKTRPLDLKHR